MIQLIDNNDFSQLKVRIKFDQNLYYTSDLHIFHKKILELVYRPTELERHPDFIINQCNNKIKNKTDIVVHLGDMFFNCPIDKGVEILSKLKGQWIFILGNHDNANKLSRIIDKCNNEYKTFHRLLGHYKEILWIFEDSNHNSVYKKLTVNCHYPIEDWRSMNYESIMCHGHCHGYKIDHNGINLSKKLNRFDLGIDSHPKNEPWEFFEILGINRNV